MRGERKFRTNKVIPFLKKLKNTAFFPIQQQAICGDPDYWLVIKGRAVWLELKATGGKERPLQKFKRQMAMDAGAIGIVTDPENWHQVSQYLELLSKGE